MNRGRTAARTARGAYRASAQTVAISMDHLIGGTWPWGFITHYSHQAPSSPRLVVTAPGTTLTQRRLWHYRTLLFTMFGPIAALLLGVAFTVVVRAPVLFAFVFAAALWTSGGVILHLATRRLPRPRWIPVIVQTHTEPGILPFTSRTYTQVANQAQLAPVAVRLDEMDAARRAGRITPAEYELRWAEVYDLLPDRTTSRKEQR